MSLQEQFDAAVVNVKNLKSLPNENDLLELYALYKQALFGDADPDTKPGMLDFRGKAKWAAWDKKKGLGKDDAMKQYTEKVKDLVAAIGLK